MKNAFAQSPLLHASFQSFYSLLLGIKNLVNQNISFRYILIFLLAPHEKWKSFNSAELLIRRGAAAH